MHVQQLAGTRGTRRWCLVLETGDELMEGLEVFADEVGLRAGRLTALGAFRRATLAFFDWSSRDYQEIPVEEQVEVTSLVGDVGRTEDGAVVVHVHCVLGRRDGSALTGHLMEGVVRPTLELFLDEGEGELTRRPDEESGLELIRP